MATIKFSSHRIAERTTNGGVIVMFDIGRQQAATPSKTFTAAKCIEVENAMAAFLIEARESGIPLQISASVKDGRSPIGFKTKFARQWTVNLDKAPLRQF